jgi:hypothetical protein
MPAFFIPRKVFSSNSEESFQARTVPAFLVFENNFLDKSPDRGKAAFCVTP